MRATQKHKATSERRIINELIIGVLFCSLVISPVSSHLMPLYWLLPLYKETNYNEEALNPAQQIFDKEIKVLSHVGAIKNAMRKPTNGIKEILYDSDNDSGIDLEPLTTGKQTGRDKFSDIAPKAFAPP
ncbi:MAG: hypothetical protein LBK58_10170 [Prevotellaceae bacterium]|jgi:hypothetical protein|nr:hypothetical protein [Prevotellaceae bacterium]